MPNSRFGPMNEGRSRSEMTVKRVLLVAATLPALLFLLTSCRVQMDIIIHSNGSGVAIVKFFTSDELIFQSLLRSAQEEAKEVRAKGGTVTIESGQVGAERYVALKQSFTHVKELSGSNATSGISLVPLESGKHRLQIPSSDSSSPSLVPIELTVKVPGRIINASAGVEIRGNSARWEGLGLPTDGLYIDFESGSSSDMVNSILIIVILVLLALGGMGLVAVWVMKSTSARPVVIMPKGKQFCTRCGATIRAGVNFCAQCGTRV